MKTNLSARIPLRMSPRCAYSLVVLLILCLIAVGCAGGGTDGTGGVSVRGVVTEQASGAPIPDVVVRLEERALETLTSSQGEFQFRPEDVGGLSGDVTLRFESPAVLDSVSVPDLDESVVEIAVAVQVDQRAIVQKEVQVSRRPTPAPTSTITPPRPSPTPKAPSGPAPEPSATPSSPEPPSASPTATPTTTPSPVIYSPAVCESLDVNGDGSINAADGTAALALFELGEFDFNQDDGVDDLDLAAFYALFDPILAGTAVCP